MSNSDKIVSPGTGQGPSQSASPLSERRGGADPSNVNTSAHGPGVNPTNSSSSDKGHV
jgi:hypothetical protein